jgi:prophage regulatory protein
VISAVTVRQSKADILDHGAKSADTTKLVTVHRKCRNTVNASSIGRIFACSARHTNALSQHISMSSGSSVMIPRSSDAMILRTREVTAVVRLSRTQLWRLIRAGKFPKPLHLSDHCRGFLASEIRDWLDSRKAARDTDGEIRSGCAG